MSVIIKYKPIVFINPIHCDKLSITLPVKTGEPEYILAAMGQMLADGHHAAPAHLQKSMYHKNMNIGLGDCGDQHLLVQAHPKKAGMSFLRLEFNPSAVDMSEIASYMNFLIPSGGHERLVVDGKVTRLDIKLDVHNAPLDQLLFTHPMFRATEALWNQGRLGTLYLGSKKSQHYFCIYDKTAEMKSKAAALFIAVDMPNHPITRIEVRLKKCFPMAALATLENQYAQLEVARPIPSSIDPELWAMFLMAAQNAGAQTALLRLSKPTRKLFKERLKAGHAHWWKPNELWKDWPAVANAILYPTASFGLGPLKSSMTAPPLSADYVKSIAIH